MSEEEGSNRAQLGRRLLTEHNLKLLNHFKKQAQTIFNCRGRLDDSVILDSKPQASASDYEVIVETVRALFISGAATKLYKPYMDILEDCGGGLKALDISDPLLHSRQLNILGYSEEASLDAHSDYYHELMYVRLLSWAREVLPMITQPELTSHSTSNFEVQKSKQFEYRLERPLSNARILPIIEQKEQLRILYDCITHTRAGCVSFYSLFHYQSPAKPSTPRMESMFLEGICEFFRSISYQYSGITAQSSSSPLTLTRTYSWYPKPIEELLPEVFNSFLSKFSDNMSVLNSVYARDVIKALQTAVVADIRVTRSISAQSVATILAAVVNRVHQLTASSFPLATMELHAEELLLHEVLGWIKKIFYSLSGIKNRRKVTMKQQLDRHHGEIYSEDAKSTVAIATALKPILLHALKTKTNPLMYTTIVSFLDEAFCLIELPEEVPMTILSNSFWAAIAAVFTAPYDGKSDAVRLHYGSRLSVGLAGTKNLTVLKTAQDWNGWAFRECCRLLSKLCFCGVVNGPILNDVGKTLVKRGLLQLLFQQEALHPDNSDIQGALADILSAMCRARDGRMQLLRASELGCRFPGIGLLRQFLLHADSTIVCCAFALCEYLLGDGDFRPLILAMDPPIEDIAAKWASLAIVHSIQRSEEQFERVQIRNQLEQLCCQKNFDVSSLNFASWSIGNDFRGSSDRRSRRYAAFLPKIRETPAAEMLMRSLVAICVLSTIMEHRDHITARPRFRELKLIGLIVTATNFPPETMVGEFSLHSVQKLLERDSFLPSDLLDPHRQLFDLVHFMIAFAARSEHGSNEQYFIHSKSEESQTLRIADAIGSLFAEERLNPTSEWNEYFLPIEETLRDGRHDKLWGVYSRMFSPPSSKPAFAAQQRVRAFHMEIGEQLSPMPLMLKMCGNGSCCKLELNRGEYMTCSKCRSMWYCSVQCQTADWKRHKKTDCKPPSSSSSAGK